MLGELGIDACVIGGIALQRWSNPRMTTDVDLTAIVGYGREVEITRLVTKKFPSRIENPEAFAVANRILLLKTANSVGVDISLGALPFEERVLERASIWKLRSIGSFKTCSAEDLIVLKAFADRPQDWIDVENVLIRQGDRLNRDLVLQELEPLVVLKEDPEILERLKMYFQKCH